MDMNTTTSDKTPFRASDYADDGTYHLLLAASGSVATIKIPSILHALSHHQNLSIRLVLNKSSLHFLQSHHEPSNPPIPSIPSPNTTNFQNGGHELNPFLQSLLIIPNVKDIHLDADEWTSPPWIRGAPILHIELRRWADLLVIAPLSANTLAKISNGLADNLLCSVVRAWDTTGKIDRVVEKGGRKQVLVAPAMNTAMWLHPVTGAQIEVLEGWGEEGKGWIEVLRPQEKELACGDVGDGAMMEWSKIVRVIEEKLGLV